MNKAAYGNTFLSNSPSLPASSTATNPIAILCGAIILPVATPKLFAATSQYLLAPILAAVDIWTDPNKALELVPDPVTNVPKAPNIGAKNG